MNKTIKEKLINIRNIIDSEINNLSDLILENEKQFENKITYIGAGSIALTLAFAKNYYEYSIILIIGMTFMCISLFINLYSALYLTKKIRNDQKKFVLLSQSLTESIDKETIDNKDIINDECDIYKTIDTFTEKRCKASDLVNIITFLNLCIGLVFSLLYIILNLI